MTRYSRRRITAGGMSSARTVNMLESHTAAREQQPPLQLLRPHDHNITHKELWSKSSGSKFGKLGQLGFRNFHNEVNGQGGPTMLVCSEMRLSSRGRNFDYSLYKGSKEKESGRREVGVTGNRECVVLPMRDASQGSSMTLQWTRQQWIRVKWQKLAGSLQDTEQLGVAGRSIYTTTRDSAAESLQKT